VPKELNVKHTLTALLFVASVLCGSSIAQTLLRTVNGPFPGIRFGAACIPVPDQNGDGSKDLLVGAPNFNGARGAIYCVSGTYLASGVGAQILWSLAPTGSVDDNFGAALADVGDVTGDGVHDFLVGEPGYDFSTSTGQQNVGAVRLVNGASHGIVSLIRGSYGDRLGTSISACGDLNSNGYVDVAIGGPDYSIVGVVRILDGIVLTQNAEVSTVDMEAVSGTFYGDRLGLSVASGFDLTGDGKSDVVIGVPGFTAGGAHGAGKVVIYDPIQDLSYSVTAFVTYEYLGSSVAIGDDYDADGVRDIVAGAPFFQNGTGYDVGRAVVFSTARVLAQTPPYEIYSFPYGGVTPPTNHADPEPHFHFGTTVSASTDLNNDGVAEILIGAPDYFTQGLSGWNFRGLVRIYSGASGQLLTSVTGGSTDRLGSAIAPNVGDLDGDGFGELALAGALSDAGGTDSGVLRCYRLFPIPASSYCIGKLNSAGCTPFMTANGIASASATTAFPVGALNVVNQKNGLLFYGQSSSATPFQGGTKCVGNPIHRTVVQASGGSASGADCTGSFSFDFNAWIGSGVDSSLTPGAEVFSQYWSRDPASPSHTSLSNALRFVVNP